MKLFGLDKEKYAAVFLSFLLSVLSLTLSVGTIFEGAFGMRFAIGTLIVEILFYFFLIATFATNGLKFTGSVAVFLMFFTSAAIITMAIEPETREYIMGPYDQPFLQQYTPRFLLYCFSGFVATSYLKDTEYFFKIFEKFCYLTVILGIVCYCVSISKKIDLQYMTFSYNMLLQVTFLLLRCITKFDIKKLICGIVGLFIIFIAGCRGALICCLISMLIYILAFKSKKSIRKVILIALAIGVILLMFFNFDGFLQNVGSFLEKNNINSRTVTKITDGTFFISEGRDEITEQIIENFNLFGHGIYTDRILTGSYAHHLLYELIYDFGYVIGGGVFLWVCWLIFSAFFKANANNRTLLCALLSAGFMKFFFSSTYLNPEPALYVLLGLGLMILRKRKEEINSIQVGEIKKNYE